LDKPKGIFKEGRINMEDIGHGVSILHLGGEAKKSQVSFEKLG